MLPLTAPRPAHTDRPLMAMHLAVDLGFGILMVVSGFRYFSNHPFDSIGAGALFLGAGSTLAYAAAVLGPENQKREAVGILTATALWLPLAVIAPSFSWCAFALVFAVHRVLRRGAATVASAVIVIAVSTGLFLMSKGQDLGLVLGPFFGGIVISTAYVALDRTLENRRLLTDELIITREQLAATEREAGALAERERFASELHDTVVQRTASALLLLESNDESMHQHAVPVAEAREVLREAMIETRQLLHGLQPPSVQQSLAAAIRELADEYRAEFTLVGTERRVDEGLVHGLLRVVQEALLNASKHADASAIRVTLTYFEDSIGVDIADDGVGFDPTEEQDETEGYGLRAMAWRIENLGGEFVFESSPGNGTVVAGIVPTATSEAGAS